MPLHFVLGSSELSLGQVQYVLGELSLGQVQYGCGWVSLGQVNILGTCHCTIHDA